MAINNDVYLGSGASLMFVPELMLTAHIDGSESTTGDTTIELKEAFSTDRQLVKDLYVGCSVELYDYDSGPNPKSTHTITSNTYASGRNVLTITPALGFDPASDDSDWAVILPYGAPCPAIKGAANNYRLNADNWLGLVESATFPNVDIEMKQLNTVLGGSRNFTRQYKGIETASGGNINLVANHGAYLYYVLGKCTGVKLTSTTSSGTDPLDDFNAHAVSIIYYDTGDTSSTAHDGAFETSHVNTGPIFYRSDANNDCLLPPVVKADTAANLSLVTVPTYNSGAIQNPITYQFAEANGADLPSFTLEQSLTKTSNVTATQGTANETESLVRIARGNRVNTMTITANENEEVKMTMDLNTRTVDSINDLTTSETYTPRNNIGTDSALFNYNETEANEPFFFSSGTFQCFGQTFLKITSLSLTINNNLMDKRFVGVSSKAIKDAFPGQRTYELSFTAMITDDLLYRELLNNTEDAGTNTVVIKFDKASGESIELNFQNYFLSSANITVPDDKGPITVDGMIMPTKLTKCEVKTHWVLQG